MSEQLQQGNRMSKEHVLVLARFNDEASADEAVVALKAWDKANMLVKLGGIGILVKDENGKIKEYKLGQSEGKKGVGIGALLGIIAAIPSGGLSLLGGVAYGAVTGGAVGSFFHNGFHELSKADAERIDQNLNAGHAVVGVLVEPVDAEAVTAQIVKHGGTPETHELSDETVQEAEQQTAGVAKSEQPPQGPAGCPTRPAPGRGSTTRPAPPAR